MLDLKRFRKNVSRMFIALMVTLFMTGCGGDTDKPGGDTGLNNYKRPVGNEAEVHVAGVSPEEAKAAVEKGV